VLNVIAAWKLRSSPEREMMSNTREDRVVSAGAPTVVHGTVIHGDKRGRLLGFPTANIAGDGVELGDGVWAGSVQLGLENRGPRFAAAISLGSRPTYYSEGGVRLIEAFLLDFDGQLYDQSVDVEFSHLIRPQTAFDDSSQLVRQLHLDVANVRTWAIRSGLLPSTSASPQVRQGRWGPTQPRRVRDRAKAAERRDLRRAELTSQAVLACPPDRLNYEWVAEWTGLPAEYLRHHYPTLEALRDVAPVNDRRNLGGLS
jgi:hypothetical protein